MKIKDILINIPNLISMSRVILIPLFLYLLFQPSMTSSFWALVVFGIASLTDVLDGWSARKLNQETEFGQFLDPLADKVLVLSTLIALVLLDPLIPLWMVLIIVGRDILLTIMRYLAIKKGQTLRTNRFGKFKTAFQMIGIVIIIMIYIVKRSGIEIGPEVGNGILQVMNSNHPKKWLIVTPYWIMFVVTILTILSGFRYLLTNWRFFQIRKSIKGNKQS